MTSQVFPVLGFLAKPFVTASLAKGSRVAPRCRALRAFLMVADIQAATSQLCGRDGCPTSLPSGNTPVTLSQAPTSQNPALTLPCSPSARKGAPEKPRTSPTVAGSLSHRCKMLGTMRSCLRPIWETRRWVRQLWQRMVLARCQQSATYNPLTPSKYND